MQRKWPKGQNTKCKKNPKKLRQYLKEDGL